MFTEEPLAGKNTNSKQKSVKIIEYVYLRDNEGHKVWN